MGEPFTSHAIQGCLSRSVLAIGGHVCQKEGALNQRNSLISAKIRVMFLMFALAVFSTGCGGDESQTAAESPCVAETRADTFSLGLEKSVDDYRVVLKSADPTTPEVGPNTWDFEIFRGSDAVSTATVSMKPWMPDHGHGTTPLFWDSAYLEQEQRYQVGPFNLIMPGLWTFTFLVVDGATEKEVVFGFCLEG